ncbi:MAG: DUF917 domain-containing protein [Proteobacteria bacterium]|nr:DUF917 domain-containing protein [Pseudomonadota bacterium]
MRLGMADLYDLARGCAFLGSGGGGDPHTSLIELEEALGPSDSIELIDADSLADDAFVAPCGWIGAPTVSAEKLPSGAEAIRGLRKLESIVGRRADAVFPIEIGGSNGLAPMLLAIRAGVPVVDGDGMGRAFPESQMVIFNVAGLKASPAVLTDDKGNCVVIDSADNVAEERIARAVSVVLGASCHLMEYPLTGGQIKATALRGTVSDALAIGRGIRISRESGHDPFAALFAALRTSRQFSSAGVLFDGKIVDLHRETRDGFSMGRATIQAFGGNSRLEVEFKNENLVARVDGVVRAVVPDLITIVDRETAESIVTERLKYGQRVKVVGASAPLALRTPEALAILGPQAFGIQTPYERIELLNHWEGGA